MYVVIYDSSKTTPTIDKIEDAINRYRDKLRGNPTTVLMNPAHGDEIPEGWSVLTILTRPFIPRFTFYIGIPEDPEEDQS
jgi:hypothetical protein